MARHKSPVPLMSPQPCMARKQGKRCDGGSDDDKAPIKALAHFSPLPHTALFFLPIYPLSLDLFPWSPWDIVLKEFSPFQSWPILKCWSKAFCSVPGIWDPRNWWVLFDRGKAAFIVGCFLFILFFLVAGMRRSTDKGHQDDTSGGSCLQDKGKQTAFFHQELFRECKPLTFFSFSLSGAGSGKSRLSPPSSSTFRFIFFLFSFPKSFVNSSSSSFQAPEGENQPSTEVDLFISTEKIMVLNTDLKVTRD